MNQTIVIEIPLSLHEQVYRIALIENTSFEEAFVELVLLGMKL